jgi:uncharacterized membrane protein
MEDITSSQFILSDANFSSFDYMAVVASAYGSRFVVSILWLVLIVVMFVLQR